MLANLDELVVKPANESGGYGVFVGTEATAAEKDEMRRRIMADPRNYIAQPILTCRPLPRCAAARSLPVTSTCARSSCQGAALRHRGRPDPGGPARGLPGGQQLPRGGSKDTWVLDPTVVRGARPTYI